MAVAALKKWTIWWLLDFRMWRVGLSQAILELWPLCQPISQLLALQVMELIMFYDNVLFLENVSTGLTFLRHRKKCSFKEPEGLKNLQSGRELE